MANPLEIFFTIFFIVIIIVICGYMATTFLNHMPPATSSRANTIIKNYTVPKQLFSNTFTLIDSALFLFVIIALVIDALASYMYPSGIKAVFNILGIFTLGIINMAFIPFASIINNSPLSANTILPTTYSFISSNYIYVILYFFMIFSIILNIRHKNEEYSSGSHE